MTYFPELETERLTLRALDIWDKEFVYKHFSDEDVCRYLFDEDPLTSLEGAEEIIEWASNAEGKNHNRWAVIRRFDNEIIGTCGFHCWDKKNNIAEIGYDLEKQYWGKGYMSEAIRAMIQSGFDNMNLNRIEAFVYLENENSIRLLKRIGFTNEGVIRDKYLFNGRYYNHYCFSLLREEWEAGLKNE